MTDFENRMEAYVKPLEQSLPEFLPDAGTPYGQVVEAMRYSLLSGGKRVRAVLLMAIYSLFSDDFRASLPFAASVEMIHAYSLIHDDLPCMDDDDLRRGQPSCHIKFGEATALLAGDGLLTLAFETLSLTRNAEHFGCDKVLSAIRSLSAASGANGMVGGQMIDLENEDKDVDGETLTLIESKKTGALIQSACEIGCILGGADEATTEHVLAYAAKLGLAFQITDDVLDISGDEKQLGKPVGSDSGNRRTTYASLYGIEEASRMAARLTEEAVKELEETGHDVVFLCELARELAIRTH